MPVPRPKTAAKPTTAPRPPVWAGPEGDGPNGGITFSLLSRFLTCRERFRVKVIEGLRPADDFEHKIEFGNMWHVCEEAAAQEVRWSRNELKGTDTTNWEDMLADYVKKLQTKYPLSQEQIVKWYQVVRLMFPVYVEHWRRHPDTVERTPLFAEQVFDVPYRLPSGRTVRLRGKWDSVDVIGKGKLAQIYLQDNKTKGDIDENQLRRQLTFDLQTMIYMVALRVEYDRKGSAAKGNLAGVRYNVIRRPRQYQGKRETAAEFYERLAGIVRENPSEFFMRWRVTVTPGDVKRFRERCLDPLLEAVVNWYDFTINGAAKSNYTGLHWQHPFGVRSILDEGGSSDLDNYLLTGSTVGLTRVDTLFPELT